MSQENTLHPVSMLASPVSQDETEINLVTPDKGPTTLTSIDKAVEPSNATCELHDKDWGKKAFLVQSHNWI